MLKRYDNHHVYQLEPKTQQQLIAINILESKADQDAYTFVDSAQIIGQSVHIIVAPKYLPQFKNMLRTANFTYQLLSENAQTELEDLELEDTPQRAFDYNWKKYHTLDGTYKWLEMLQMQYPQFITLYTAGYSYENRKILAVKLSKGAVGPRRSIFLEAGMHAREWITPAVVTYILQQLLTNTDRSINVMSERYDWYIVPHANPDGYVYTYTVDRLWRKTRKPHISGCFGADPNRNWDYHWGFIGSNNNPCSNIYAGSRPFSERETYTLANFISTFKKSMLLYVSIHSYGQYLLYPYGHTNSSAPNAGELKHIMDAGISGVKQRYGTVYTGGNIYDTIYPTSGTSVDWAYGVAEIKYAYAFELRPSSKNYWTGFRLPANQIIPTSEETLDALIEMIKTIETI
ncbi:zinc carboxypeptidase A 1-like [Teleopsis dalmanni]|uniref:zinc carboxypeptidase A 1-like n=1 Tax=Teleopsis dalmanni TaxID=139649 RepID=UPI0018CCC577|nr:zinc carboxypeptidase A 1-like [Teleopsis dalmanni]XP_037959357.1 zinc carboxypeptidase A 1-like [Teleopsis dalmanni]